MEFPGPGRKAPGPGKIWFIRRSTNFYQLANAKWKYMANWDLLEYAIFHQNPPFLGKTCIHAVLYSLNKVLDRQKLQNRLELDD